MSDRFFYYQERMKNAPDDYLPGNESDIVKELIQESPLEIKETLGWIVEKHVGYVAPRVLAGEKLFEIDQEFTWQLIEKLIVSKDPDDRDVALTLIAKIKDTSKYYLALSVLNDEFAYLILEAAEILWQIYPNETRLAAVTFLDDQNENIRNPIKQIIENIDSIS